MREINLLPPTRRASLRRQALMAALTRFLNVVISGLASLLLVGVTASLSLWLLGYLVPSETQATLNEAVAAYQEVRDEVGTTNFFLAEIDRIEQERLVWSEEVARLLAALPPSIQLRSLTGKAVQAPDDTRQRSLSITGQAESRSILTLLQDRLRAQAGVTAVEGPNSNFLQRDNPVFTFEITLE